MRRQPVKLARSTFACCWSSFDNALVLSVRNPSREGYQRNRLSMIGVLVLIRGIYERTLLHISSFLRYIILHVKTTHRPIVVIQAAGIQRLDFEMVRR